MPEACFSYPTGPCFSYPAGPCFSYSTRAPRATYDLPGTFGGGGGVMGPCFSYPADLPLAGPRRTPSGNPSPCFSYTGARTTHPDFTGGSCFRY